MNDLTRGGLRTAIQALVALLLAAPPVAALLTFLADYGVSVDVPALEEALLGIAAGLVAIGMNWLQKKVPWLGKFLGGSPAYQTKDDDPDAEEVAA